MARMNRSEARRQTLARKQARALKFGNLDTSTLEKSLRDEYRLRKVA